MPEIKIIQTDDEFEELVAASHEHPVWILKHSITCGVSFHAREEYEHHVKRQPVSDEATYALVHVQYARDLCRMIAARTGIAHESPQAILLRAGRAAWHANHWAIDRAALARAAAG